MYRQTIKAMFLGGKYPESSKTRPASPTSSLCLMSSRAAHRPLPAHRGAAPEPGRRDPRQGPAHRADRRRRRHPLLRLSSSILRQARRLYGCWPIEEFLPSDRLQTQTGCSSVTTYDYQTRLWSAGRAGRSENDAGNISTRSATRLPVLQILTICTGSKSKIESGTIDSSCCSFFPGLRPIFSQVSWNLPNELKSAQLQTP